MAYVRPGDDDRMFVFPPRALHEFADPHHVADVRHHLRWWGMMTDVEFDRWLCGVRFGDVCREPVTAGVSHRENGRATD